MAELEKVKLDNEMERTGARRQSVWHKLWKEGPVLDATQQEILAVSMNVRTHTCS
jgi:hypothetical protein